MNAPIPAATASGPLLLRHDNDGAPGVTTLTLNRPAQFNLLSSAMLAALQDALDAIDADRSVRVVVLAASGRGFCAGHDLREIRGLTAQDGGEADGEAHADGCAEAEAHSREQIQALFTQCNRMMMTLSRIAQPVIARVHGVAAAAGCQLVAACDLAIASSPASFATPGVNHGFFCSTPGVALGRTVARKHALEMLLGGDAITAQRAAEIGLVNRVVAPDALDAETTRWAVQLAAKPALTVAQGKRLFHAQIDMDLAAAYQAAGTGMACGFMTPDAREGMDAFIDKRLPAWAAGGEVP
jgi:enoyl-CoA hydratase/carnithine racemase